MSGWVGSFLTPAGVDVTDVTGGQAASPAAEPDLETYTKICNLKYTYTETVRKMGVIFWDFRSKDKLFLLLLSLFFQNWAPTGVQFWKHNIKLDMLKNAWHRSQITTAAVLSE